MQRTLRRIGAGTLDLVLPPRCPSCREIVSEERRFCGPCWTRLDFLTAPWCGCCGLPFEIDAGADALCGACAGRTPPYDSVRAALRYDAAAARLILALKYGDRPHLARILATMMRRLVPDAPVPPLVVPVPLNRWRLWSRGYNQAALLARALARNLGAPLGIDLLDRHRPTPSSRGLSRAARFRNVQGAIRARSPAPSDRAVLLVDDVFTTGATAEACARALKRAGAARVDMVVLARITRTD